MGASGVQGQFPPATPEELVDWLLVQIEDLHHEAEALFPSQIARTLASHATGVSVATNPNSDRVF